MLVQEPVTNEQAGAALDLHIHDTFVFCFFVFSNRKSQENT